MFVSVEQLGDAVGSSNVLVNALYVAGGILSGLAALLFSQMLFV